MKPSYRIERVVDDARRIEQEAFLLASVFSAPERYTPAYLNWQYFANPSGDIVGFDAYEGDEIAAHYVVQPIEARLFGETVKGVLSLNTATGVKHQGQGLFVRLASATFDLARELGYRFVMGVANANSTPGFIRRLSFQLVSPLDAELGFGPVEAVPAAAIEFEQLWSEDARMWRLSNPVGRYRISRGRLYSATHLPLVQMQLSTDRWARADTAHGAVPSAVLTAWIGLSPSRCRKGVALPVPRRFRPSPLNYIFLDLTGSGRRLRPGNVVMNAVDFDAY